jgi:hypothetical protein
VLSNGIKPQRGKEIESLPSKQRVLLVTNYYTFFAQSVGSKGLWEVHLSLSAHFTADIPIKE